jgi:hypothetical protein
MVAYQLSVPFLNADFAGHLRVWLACVAVQLFDELLYRFVVKQ